MRQPRTREPKKKSKKCDECGDFMDKHSVKLSPTGRLMMVCPS